MLELLTPKMIARWAKPKRPKVMAIYSAIKLAFFLYSQKPKQTIIMQKIKFRIVTGSRIIAIMEPHMQIIFISRYVNKSFDNIET